MAGRILDAPRFRLPPNLQGTGPQPRRLNSGFDDMRVKTKIAFVPHSGKRTDPSRIGRCKPQDFFPFSLSRPGAKTRGKGCNLMQVVIATCVTHSTPYKRSASRLIRRARLRRTVAGSHCRRSAISTSRMPRK